MKILIDTRERLSYAEYFDNLGIGYEVCTLKTGDYQLEGCNWVVERKNLEDWTKSITIHRKRFVKELERAKELDFFAIIIWRVFVLAIFFWIQYQFHSYFIWLRSYIHFLIQAFNRHSAQQEATPIY